MMKLGNNLKLGSNLKDLEKKSKKIPELDSEKVSSKNR